MKYSQYNSIIPINEQKYLFYNAFSDKFIVINDITKETIDTADPNDLIVYNNSLYGKLTEAGAIIESETDEVAALKKKIEKIDNDDSFFLLHINPTVDCNFRCWYCYEDHVKDSKMSSGVIESIKKLAAKILTDKPDLKYFNFSFFGGEPLMYFNDIAKPLITYFDKISGEKNIDYSTHFTSNGYLITDDIIDFLKDKKCGFQITLDGYKEEHDKVRSNRNGTGSYDRIIANIKKLVSLDIEVILRINYTTQNIADTGKIAAEFDDLKNNVKKNLTVDFQRVWQDLENEDISETVKQNIACFSEKGYTVSYHNVINRVDDSCYGDKRNHVVVNYNGDVFKCTARDFTTENRAGYLSEDGKIVWNGDYLDNRMMAKFLKEICHTCKIAPLCGGGCTQQATEKKYTDTCLYEYAEDDMNRIILDRFESMFLSNAH